MKTELIEVALQLAFEAGRWHGQVDLEEHYDREQYLLALAEAHNSRITGMPADRASDGRTVRVNLRSDKWREGVKTSAQECMEKAKELLLKNEQLELF